MLSYAVADYSYKIGTSIKKVAIESSAEVILVCKSSIFDYSSTIVVYNVLTLS